MGGRPVPRIQLGVDLDNGDRRARSVASKKLGGYYFDQNVVTVRKDEKLSFSIGALARDRFYRWSIEFLVEVGGRVHVVPVELDGVLTVTGYSRSYRSAYVWQENGTLTHVRVRDVCSGDCRDLPRAQPGT
jgi:hypothetical protein